MERLKSAFSLNAAWVWILVVLLVLMLVIVFLPERYRLHGLLLDLELGDPRPGRHEKLKDALTRKLPDAVAALRQYEVTLDYSHFSTCTESTFDKARVDFLVLSPQGTPWHIYTGDAAARLDRVKCLVKQAILNEDLPVLGVCGGHQFLALVFGGTVDFIDPGYMGAFPGHYPTDALSERGVVFLDTLRDDPIFQGVASHPGRFRAVQSHYEEVKAVPEPFVNLAASDMSLVQILRMPEKCVYGVAFHPERCWDQSECPASPVLEGRQILANFLTMVIRKRP